MCVQAHACIAVDNIDLRVEAARTHLAGRLSRSNTIRRGAVCRSSNLAISMCAMLVGMAIAFWKHRDTAVSGNAAVLAVGDVDDAVNGTVDCTWTFAVDYSNPIAHDSLEAATHSVDAIAKQSRSIIL